MAVYNLPATMRPKSCEWGFSKGGEMFKSNHNGNIQSVEFVAERFIVGLTLPPCLYRSAEAGAREAFFGRLTGGFNWVRLHHFARDIPIGTMRGTPTLFTGVSRGASSLVIQSTVGSTLLAGDLFGLGGQLFMVADDATADGSGRITVNLVHRVRATINAGGAVTWNRPTATFLIPSFTSRFAYEAMVLGQVPFDLEEVWAP